MPVPAVANELTSALQNMVIADAVLRSAAGILVIRRLYSPGELIHCIAEKLR